ncbi:T9SS type A sorting domain-containing protein [Flammeovirga sp. EKP202]|uniref:VPS10 domain-containing protein n=1 Tax=Flammeovirga sp. EKP202 TaxID=2770592 RepID=UPI00166006A5|nr:T9SS type A sorting domain-containing protein [Flammeovirga sp. EKP202]MBD0402231.1 T9SS type A sorting domain-containing protein [Flammeovirga sp. EKP202]
MINQKHFLSGLLFLMTFGVFYYFYQGNHHSEEIIQHQSKDIVFERYNEKRLKKNAKGYIKSDKPDKFLQLMRSLKVRDGQNEAQYQKGYKLKETLKANAYFKSNRRIAQTVTDEQWIERGPKNVPGRTRTLVVDKNDPSNNTWIIGSVSGGIWKTTNKGQNWTPLTDDLPTLSVSHISQSESDPNILYACTGEGYGNIDGVKGDGVFKSTDGGNTWFSLENTLNNEDFQIVNRLIIDPTNADNLTVCTSANPGNSYRSSIFVSKDGGESWTKTYEERRSGFSFAIHQVVASPDDFNVQYATINNKGILKSTDMGQSWSLLSGYRVTGRIELGISEVNPNFIYASIAGNGDASEDGNLYLSRDAGNTWALLGANDEIKVLGGQGWYDNAVLAHPYDENSFYVGGVDIWKINILDEDNNVEFQRVSDAYGASGRTINPSFFRNGSTIIEGLHPDHHSFVSVKTTENQFYIINTNDGGVYYSNTGTNPGEDNGDWTFAGYGYNTTQFYGIDKRSGVNQYIGGSQDNGTWISSTNPTKDSNYRMFIGGDGFDAIWHSEDEDKLLGSIYNNIIYKSNNRGSVYFESTNGLEDQGENAPFITKLANSKQNPDVVFAIGEQGVWKSSDFGSNWTLSPISSDQWGVSTFMDVEISEANTDVVWAGHNFSDALYVSKNDGVSFSPTGNNVDNLSVSGSISGIVPDPIYEENAYVLFSYANSPKILKTTDFGENWVDISGFHQNESSATGFPNVAVYDLLVFPFNDNYLWAGTEIGIFESLDGGASWHPLDGIIPNVCIWDMKYSDNQVYVGTHGRGIWSIDIPINPQPEIISYTSTLTGIEVSIKIDAAADSIVMYSKSKKRIKGFNTSYDEGEHLLELDSSDLTENAIQFISYKNNTPYKGKVTTLDITPYYTPSDSYYNEFTDYSTSSDFIAKGISFQSSVTNFDFAALHSEHPYATNTINYCYLRTPIIVKDDNPNFFYKDVTLVATDDDYVSIEAKKGDDDWVNISGSYNASFNRFWEHYSNLGSNGAQNLEIRHQINLKEFYSAGDTILIRFKLSSGEINQNWGWAVTYLNIQSIEEDPVSSSVNQALFQSIKVYPTEVVNNETNVELETKGSEIINYQLVNLEGKVLQSSSFATLSGKNKVPITLKTNEKGMYILVLYNDEIKKSFKIAVQ